MKKGMTIATLIVAGVTISSSVLFSMQGGFGGGHGDFDRAIFFLGLPWAAVPWPEVLNKHDFIWLIALPFVLNVLCLFLIGVTMRKFRRTRV
jgi:hypothetical protein